MAPCTRRVRSGKIVHTETALRESLATIQSRQRLYRSHRFGANGRKQRQRMYVVDFREQAMLDVNAYVALKSPLPYYRPPYCRLARDHSTRSFFYRALSKYFIPDSDRLLDRDASTARRHVAKESRRTRDPKSVSENAHRRLSPLSPASGHVELHPPSSFPRGPLFPRARVSLPLGHLCAYRSGQRCAKFY